MHLWFLLRVSVFFVLTGLLLFGTAGRRDLPMFWAYLAVLFLFVLVALLLLDPELIQERRRPAPGGKDRSLRIVALALIGMHWIVAALDVGRFHWSDTIPLSLQAAGLLCLAGGLALSLWAMTVNRFFSPVVRIQSERGHHLVDSGPYRLIRHPGYLGSLLGCVGGSLSLGSYWSMVPVAAVFFLVLRRVVIEDRFLRENLEGYADYSLKVRYRLLPGIW